MGLLSKIKGIFIEDVPDDEEEEKKDEKEITVAKKIENKEKEKEREKEKEKEVVERRVDREPKEVLELETPVYDEKKEEKLDQTKEYEKNPGTEFKFGFSDDDFKVEEVATTPKEEPKKEVETPKKNVVLYHQSTVTTVKDNYKETSYHEVYEANGNREEKHTFQRSPIISPVWGILDKNYKKDEIVTKRDIRLTTNNQKADLDAVREKAYGDLANDISSSIEEKTNEAKEDTSMEDNLLYDLSDNEGPSVKKVTVGDAEEYYSDLGLEYNVDYKMEKEEPKDEDEGKELELVQNSLENEEIIDSHNDEDEENEDDNLFDLINSMYDDKEWVWKY